MFLLLPLALDTFLPDWGTRGRRSREVDLPATTRPGRPIRASHLCKRDGRSRAVEAHGRQRRGWRSPRSTVNVTRDSAIHPPGGLLPGAMPRSHGGTYPPIHFNLNRGCQPPGAKPNVDRRGYHRVARRIPRTSTASPAPRTRVPFNTTPSIPHDPLFTYIDSRLLR